MAFFAQVVLCLVLVLVTLFELSQCTLVPWKYGGYDSFPVMWFGATIKGETPVPVEEFITRFPIAGWGWQTDNVGQPQEEEILLNTVLRFRQFLEDTGKPKPDALFVYRSAFNAMKSYKSSTYPEDYIHNPKYSEYWISDRNGNKCWDNLTPTYQGPVLNFSNAGARAFWMNNIVGQIIYESEENKRPYNSVFFDDIDNMFCQDNLPHTNCTFTMSLDERRKLVLDTVQVMADTTKALNKVGIIPALSWRTLLKKYIRQLPDDKSCPVEEEIIIEALNGTQWIRYYEEFPHWADPRKDGLCVRNAIDTTLKYGSKVVPSMQIHSYWFDLESDLDPFYVASFYMAQDDYSYYFATNGWNNENQLWWPSYDKSCGRPLGLPVEIADGVYKRNFTKCHVWIDANTYNGSVVYD